MNTHRPADRRGLTRIDWLDSRHTFSFAGYHDPAHMGFRSLRVINDDRVGPGGGFDTHPHRDMEIVTVMMEGGLAHADSMGHRSILEAGGVQRMSAGRGVFHSEHNASADAPLRLLQIWIQPAARGLAPSYEEGRFAAITTPGTVETLAAPDKADGALRIHQDARIVAVHLAPGGAHTHPLLPGRGAWVQAFRGGIAVNGVALADGDGLSVEGEEAAHFTAGAEPGAALLFDLA